MRSSTVDIVKRTKSGGKTIRELDCGHTQEEPRGGKAHLAKWTKCRQCQAGEQTNYGLSGNSGLFAGNNGIVVHLNAPFGNNEKGTVFVEPDPKMFGAWERMPKAEAEKKGLVPIRCRYCPEPAVRLSHSYPYVMGGTSCAKHLDRDDGD